MPEISTLSGDFYVGGTVTVDVSGSPTNMGYFKWRFASSLDITSIIGALPRHEYNN